MNKTQLAERVSAKTTIPQMTVLRVIDQVETVVVEQLVKGDDVLLTGFIKFEPVDQPARTRRNPSTGETVDVPPKRVVRVKAMKTLKDAVRDG